MCSIYKQHTHMAEVVAPIPSNSSETERSDTAEEMAKENEVPNISSSERHCLICEKYDMHKRRYTIARQNYEHDVSKKWDDGHEIYAVDMQKILILPKMTIKNSFFVSRLVVFHETFANLKPAGENKCVLWHEAIMGRNSPDVVSAYYNVLTRLDNKTKHMVLWADNCTSQNKNWVLFTACIIFVNQDWGPESITFKYFEPGHSFMRADSVYGQIGKKMEENSRSFRF